MVHLNASYLCGWIVVLIAAMAAFADMNQARPGFELL
jgi:hypothetical protein